MSWEYFAAIIIFAVLLNVIVGVTVRMRPKKYEKKPEFSWDKLDGVEKRSDGPGESGN